MRLLNVRTLELKRFPSPHCRPPYIIASHRWGEDEASFSDFQPDADDGRSKSLASTAGLIKVQRFCSIIRLCRRDIDWLWIDTCCIDKRDLNELARAINSMYKWYSEAVECFAYLADVLRTGKMNESEWFRRGWTLQELIAPNTVVFFAQDWSVIGHKRGPLTKRTEFRGPVYNGAIANITGIPLTVLHGASNVSRCHVDSVMAWTRNRETTEEEDLTYSLLGLFGVYMGLIYGEGHDNARRRLAEEISKKNAWNIRSVMQSVSTSRNTGTQNTGTEQYDQGGDRTVVDTVVPPQSSSVQEPIRLNTAANVMPAESGKLNAFLQQRWFHDTATGESFYYRYTNGQLVKMYQREVNLEVSCHKGEPWKSVEEPEVNNAGKGKGSGTQYSPSSEQGSDEEEEEEEEGEGNGDGEEDEIMEEGLTDRQSAGLPNTSAAGVVRPPNPRSGQLPCLDGQAPLAPVEPQKYAPTEYVQAVNHIPGRNEAAGWPPRDLSAGNAGSQRSFAHTSSLPDATLPTREPDRASLPAKGEQREGRVPTGSNDRTSVEAALPSTRRTSLEVVAAPYSCHYTACSAAGFHRKADLERHIRPTHEHQFRQFECKHPGCHRKGDYGFTRQDEMVEHHRDVHGYHQ